MPAAEPPSCRAGHAEQSIPPEWLFLAGFLLDEPLLLRAEQDRRRTAGGRRRDFLDHLPLISDRVASTDFFAKIAGESAGLHIFLVGRQA
jgi:hypothetical protein